MTELQDLRARVRELEAKEQREKNAAAINTGRAFNCDTCKSYTLIDTSKWESWREKPPTCRRCLNKMAAREERAKLKEAIIGSTITDIEFEWGNSTDIDAITIKRPDGKVYTIEATGIGGEDYELEFNEVADE